MIQSLVAVVIERKLSRSIRLAVTATIRIVSGTQKTSGLTFFKTTIVGRRRRATTIVECQREGTRQAGTQDPVDHQ